jgi:ABC-type branched-subunit amino acid transport system substrate-binding protein
MALAPEPGTGRVKVALILPLSDIGNAGTAGQAMRNAAEMALAEFSEPNIQLLTKDDGGTGPGAQLAARQAIDEGAEIILGPHGVPIIAFSTDTKVASPGVYLLSFLPEADVDRVVAYAISKGKRSFVGLVPSNPYGTVVEGEFKQAVSRGGGRVLAIEHYKDRDKIGDAVRLVAQAAGRADAMFIPDGGDAVTDVVAALEAAGINLRQLALLGTQLWNDDAKIFSNPLLAGGWYPAPDPAGFRAFSDRYRSRYGQDDPPRVAGLAYDAVALVAALKKKQGSPRITNEVLTSPSGFDGIDGRFRFRDDGTNQRGLAILRVTPSGGQVIVPASRTFNASAL